MKIQNKNFLFNRENKFDPYISHYKKVGQKTGGATEGGVYSLDEGGKKITVLFKQGREDGEVIAEYLSSRLYNLTTNQAAKCFLAKWDENVNTTEKTPQGLSKNIYIGSVFFENYNDLFKAVGLNERMRFAKILHSDKVLEAVDLIKANQDRNYGFEDLLASTLWQENRDVHWGNWGVVRDKANNIDAVVAIDFGWAFHNIQDKVSLFGHSKYLTPGKPTNHFWDYSVDNRKLYLSEAFAEALDKVTNISSQAIRSNIEDSLKEVSKFYDQEAIKNFGQRIGMPKKQLQDITIEGVTTYLTEKLENRQNSLKKLATEIKLDLAITKNKNGQYIFDREAIDKLITNNPSFFTSKKGVAFRNLQHKADAKFLNNIITSIVQQREDISSSKTPNLSEKVQELAKDIVKYIDEILAKLNLSRKHKINESKKENITPSTKSPPHKKVKVSEHKAEDLQLDSDNTEIKRIQLKKLAQEAMRYKPVSSLNPQPPSLPKTLLETTSKDYSKNSNNIHKHDNKLKEKNIKVTITNSNIVDQNTQLKKLADEAKEFMQKKQNVKSKKKDSSTMSTRVEVSYNKQNLDHNKSKKIRDKLKNKNNQQTRER